MKVTLQSTKKLVTVNGVPARIWEGQTESGIKVHAYVTRIAIDKAETRTREFETELLEKAGIAKDNPPAKVTPGLSKLISKSTK